MPLADLPEQQLDRTRRRGYVLVSLGVTAAYSALSVSSWSQGDWRPLVGVLIGLLLTLTILLPRVPLQRIDALMAVASDFGALFALWSVSRNAGPFSAQTMLMFSIFCVVWFGILHFRAALIRTALLCVGMTAIALVRQPAEPIPLLYFILLSFLIGQMTFTGRQIRHESAARAHYADLAMTDALTGLLNRRALYERLQSQYSRSRGAAQGTGLGVLLLDLDHFKQVNDNYGHDIGDRVLQHVAGVLSSCVLPGDQVARWGGEEFLMLVATDERRALEQRSHRVLATLRTIHSGLPPVTMSIGVAHASEATDVDSLLRLADRRMYRAKRDGRDRMNKDTMISEPDRWRDQTSGS